MLIAGISLTSYNVVSLGQNKTSIVARPELNSEIVG